VTEFGFGSVAPLRHEGEACFTLRSLSLRSGVGGVEGGAGYEIEPLPRQRTALRAATTARITEGARVPAVGANRNPEVPLARWLLVAFGSMLGDSLDAPGYRIDHIVGVLAVTGSAESIEGGR
jgi:hypothetical protein